MNEQDEVAVAEATVYKALFEVADHLPMRPLVISVHCSRCLRPEAECTCLGWGSCQAIAHLRALGHLVGY